MTTVSATPSSLNRAAKTNVLSRAVLGSVTAGSNFAASNAHTYHHLLELGADFQAIRIAIPNLEAGAVNGVTAAVAVTASKTSTINPTVGTGLTNDMTSGWVQATFSSATSVNLPARISANVPSVTWSDWIPLKSLPRSDSGTYPLLMVRITHPSGTAAFTYIAANQNINHVALGSKEWLVIRQGVDGVTTPTDFTNTGATSTMALYAVQARVNRPSTTILFVGDSLTEGRPGPGTDGNGWARRLVDALSTAARPVSGVNHGRSGQSTADFYTRAIARLSDIRPEIAYMSPYSPNDNVSSENNLNKMIARAMDFVYQCQLLEIKPVISTCVPSEGTANGAFMTAMDTFVRDLAAQRNIPMLDWRLVLDDDPTAGGGSGLFKSGLKFDAWHPNNAGHQAMADHAVPIIRRIL